MTPRAVDNRPPYWMQQWQAHLEKSGRTDLRAYRIYDIDRPKAPSLPSACAEGVISRIGDAALELREPKSVFSGYLVWFGLLVAAPFMALSFHVHVPQTLSGTLAALWLASVALCAVCFGAHWIFLTLQGLLRPSPLDVGLLCDRRNQRLWWRDNGKDRWVAWDRIRVVHRAGCPATETTEDLRLLVLNEDDALAPKSQQDPEPLELLLPTWGVGHQCAHSHENEAGKAVLDFVAVFMRHGPEALPATHWRTPGQDRERLFLDLARTLDFFTGPRTHASKKVRAFCAVLMALAAPFLLPPQWMHALAEFRRPPGEWSTAALQAIGVDPDSPATRLATPTGSRPRHTSLDREQRVLAWTWIASAFAIYFIVGWQIAH